MMDMYLNIMLLDMLLKKLRFVVDTKIKTIVNRLLKFILSIHQEKDIS